MIGEVSPFFPTLHQALLFTCVCVCFSFPFHLPLLPAFRVSPASSTQAVSFFFSLSFSPSLWCCCSC
ncbi:hypothetical protein ABB37_06433 [Leptomonas pyrrhocoris]|uniref:Uncharacterized protein n=1 Tax=Leptomonas pyrrhocoris TaxID=157538 RepID=A0A0N0DU18_LEPPY|nr:hypothetical protein ABB37_06433 [Leptomonas pyrrhocoris]KPA78292.1 hypothetical protein ABB37_06433 [Leptomonas pyrrhocoris]|eukprot:XP_015656731.1 hypothetical protein ABB37_06433 [Leptomonas pyrrhocoris]